MTDFFVEILCAKLWFQPIHSHGDKALAKPHTKKRLQAGKTFSSNTFKTIWHQPSVLKFLKLYAYSCICMVTLTLKLE